MSTADHRNLLAQVASYYYDEELTQSQIAERLGISRVKVYRLLKEARAEDIVQIVINWPINRAVSLEQALKQEFQLKDALVLESAQSNLLPALSRLGQLGARYLEQILDDGMTMAVCVGRSTYEVIHAIRPGFRARVDISQAMGAMPFALQEIDSAALARHLAVKLGGEVRYLSSPLMADSPEAAAIMRSQRDIRRTLDAARTADVALVGIGNLDPAISGFAKAGFISGEELDQLKQQGAIGDIAGHIFNMAGQLQPCAYNERLIGITLAELGQIATTIAVAVGREKGRAMLGALRTGVIDVLCTDDRAAEEILRLHS
ncbi:MAG: sugar-binding transcriptional regulator [Roseiflexaceae bacterium]|nr:sugar-binding transcriptional regulator [Roseiflexaceae bacterium]